MKSVLLSPRGFSECRACGNQNLSSILDLGSQPLPSEYANTANDVLDIFPLHLKICPVCSLGQLGEYVLPERIFHNTYPYISSASITWLQHCKTFANEIKERLDLKSSDLVIELASNDGYLLSNFSELGVRVLGIEPALNVAKISEKKGIPVINEFFSATLAKEIVKEYGHPKLVIANNVLAHVPDINDFTSGMSILANESTLISIENPSFAKLLKLTLFDTIYHEHYSYLSVHSVQTIAKLHGLELFHVEKLSTHGGSNRYWLSKDRKYDDTVTKLSQEEVDNGLFNPAEWANFAKRVNSSIEGFRQWLSEKKRDGAVVAAYGAAHKGNTFLNSVGVVAKQILYAVDASEEKQGKFLPGSQIPVFEPEYLMRNQPTDILILPWNIAPELALRAKKMLPAVRVWIAQPQMKLLE
jgi:hypothetical protein